MRCILYECRMVQFQSQSKPLSLLSYLIVIDWFVQYVSPKRSGNSVPIRAPGSACVAHLSHIVHIHVSSMFFKKNCSRISCLMTRQYFYMAPSLPTRADSRVLLRLASLRSGKCREMAQYTRSCVCMRRVCFACDVAKSAADIYCVLGVEQVTVHV